MITRFTKKDNRINVYNDDGKIYTLTGEENLHLCTYGDDYFIVLNGPSVEVYDEFCNLKQREQLGKVDEHIYIEYNHSEEDNED